MLAFLLAWPRYFFPFLWGAVSLILEPVNIWLRNRSLLNYSATKICLNFSSARVAQL